ncbi:protein FAR-RED-ELONGATED HYPOCOTYL 1-LIKE [Rosa rugosa]|uniref:protein FAR-RED-ELONGATED HYPOCOTYL 1-LIKE n=1 Tax=Rosa rugosa TaxID=74645 RepID=UPI002B412326|nr:protein FAR-RED-ELONGATED HYPOCOTYL 1-LIKE [Rosa rugosa]
MEMDAEYKQSPTEIDSFPVIEVGKTIKKRKLQAEQLGLPAPKHKCWDLNFLSDEHVSMFDENLDQVQNMQTHVVKREIEGVFLNDGSGPGSGKGSNSLAGHYCDSAMSVYSEAELNAAYAKSVYDRPSTSSVNCNVNIFKDTDSSLDTLSAMEANYSEAELELMNVEVHQPIQNLEEQLQEFGGEANYICSEYGDHFIEECTDKEVEDIIYSNSLNPHTYVLSSGRWSVNQEAQSGSSRKPTIDQEFEQYFSSLML